MAEVKAFGYSGLEKGGTFEIDAATTLLVKENPQEHIGKVVTIKNGMASFGTSGDFVFGVIEAIEPYQGRKEAWVMTVGFAKSYVDVPIGITKPVSGQPIAVDGTGKAIVAPDGTFANAYAWFVDTKATIKVL